MAEDALKRFNGKAKPYFQRPFKINWGIKKSTQAQTQPLSQFQPQEQTKQRNNLNSFLTPNSFNLLNKTSAPLNENQRIQAATLKALGLSGEVQYQPTPLSITNTSGIISETGNKPKTMHPIYNKTRTPIEINPTTYNPNNPVSIYVGDLDRNCDFSRLENIFKQFYSTVVGAKIIKDPSTRMSKGYGFVMFASPEEAEIAIEEMHGFQIMSRKIRTGKSMNKSGMAPIRGSGNGCGIIGNGLSTVPESKDETEKGSNPPTPYPGMMMFNNLGYPVNYSQFYNFNMINMPYPVIPGETGESQQIPSNVEQTKGFNSFTAQNPQMVNPYYTQAYQQMYANNPNFYLNQAQMQPQSGLVDTNKTEILTKRSNEVFKSENIQNQKMSQNMVSNDLSLLVEKNSVDSDNLEDLKFGGVNGWFGKEDISQENKTSQQINELITDKFDWFSSAQNSCNKFVIEFFDL